MYTLAEAARSSAYQHQSVESVLKTFHVTLSKHQTVLTNSVDQLLLYTS